MIKGRRERKEETIPSKKRNNREDNTRKREGGRRERVDRQFKIKKEGIGKTILGIKEEEKAKRRRFHVRKEGTGKTVLGIRNKKEYKKKTDALGYEEEEFRICVMRGGGKRGVGGKKSVCSRIIKKVSGVSFLRTLLDVVCVRLTYIL